MEYYKLIRDCTHVGVEASVGSVCYKITFNGDGLNIYHFPNIGTEYYLIDQDIEKITKEEYAKEIWKLKKNI